MKDNGIVFHASAKDFVKIPGSPVAYWVSERFKKCFEDKQALDFSYNFREGIHTANNALFLKLWYEISFNLLVRTASSYKDIDNSGRWVPYNKGGTYRKWFGNNEYVISFDQRARDQMASLIGHVRPSQDLYFKEGGTWTAVSCGSFGIRYYPNGFLFDAGGQVAVGKDIEYCISYLNSKLFGLISKIVMPTINSKCGIIKTLPNLCIKSDFILKLVHDCIYISCNDWDNYETSWNYMKNPLFGENNCKDTLSVVFTSIRHHWSEMTTEMHRLEEENNRIFIEAYGLQDELTPEVPWDEITLTCNPWYRYGVTPPNPTCEEFPVDEALEARLKSDTMKEFLSYAVGCMFGRYSLDKPGLVLANQGETLEDYLKQIPQPTFMPDEDNVLPILDEDWFADDIVARFSEFLKTTFGEAHFFENLAFIEEALGKDVRSYFLKEFYKDHLQRYHNRPIYWLFSSPKGAFNALIYIHRYCPETVGLVLTYLRSYISKVNERIHTLETTIDSLDSTAGMKSKAIRERAKLQMTLRELEDYERDVLYPLATEKIAIDLDDGVKGNYRKFGDALYKIKGLEAKEE